MLAQIKLNFISLVLLQNSQGSLPEDRSTFCGECGRALEATDLGPVLEELFNVAIRVRVQICQKVRFECNVALLDETVELSNFFQVLQNELSERLSIKHDN